MALKLTLKPNERIIVNGCVIRNSDRRHFLDVENKADVVRESDLLDESDAGVPVKEVYFFAQTCLLNTELREKLIPILQAKLGRLVPVFHDEVAGNLVEAANHVSTNDFYKAMRALRPVIQYEERLYEMMHGKAPQTAAE